MPAWINGRLAAALMGYLSRANAQEHADASPLRACCHQCKLPHKKYYSIADDSGRWLCGETCIREASYPVFHIFEKNLTAAHASRPCASDGYTAYVETVTHGVPGLECTLDLYACPAGACPHPEAQLPG